MHRTKEKTHEKNLGSNSGVRVLDAAHSANWAVPGMAVNLNNQNGWPITAATFIIVYEASSLSTKEVVKFFDYAFSRGDRDALGLDYVPLPDKVKNAVRADWKRLGFL